MEQDAKNVILKPQNYLEEEQSSITESENAYAKRAFITLPISQDEKKSENLPKIENYLVPSTPTTEIKNKNKKQKGWRKYLGIMLTILAALQFSFSALIIKILNYHPFNLGVWRFFVMMLIPIPFLWYAIFWKKQKVFKILWPVNSTLIYLGVSYKSISDFKDFDRKCININNTNFFIDSSSSRGEFSSVTILCNSKNKCRRCFGNKYICPCFRHSPCFCFSGRKVGDISIFHGNFDPMWCCLHL
jgi:hypothetical protein